MRIKAAVLTSPDSIPQWMEFDLDKFEENWKTVKVHAAALNRRDYWITKGQYPGIKFPIILGSDLCGTIEGQDVIVNPGFNWGPDRRVQSNDFHILGLPSHGSLAEFCHVPKSNIYPRPGHLNHNEAAALPLAGVTAYRALFTKGEIKEGDKVLVTGIGGGVATMCLQFALAAKAEVYVTSSSEIKLEKALDLGAKGAYNYKSEGYEKQILKDTNGLDLIIDGAGGIGISQLMKCMNPAGTIVMYGGTTGNIPQVNPQLLFWRQLNLKGSTMGSPSDFESMLSFVLQHKIIPIIDKVYFKENLDQAFESMANSNQFGKIVIDLQ